MPCQCCKSILDNPGDDVVRDGYSSSLTRCLVAQAWRSWLSLTSKDVACSEKTSPHFPTEVGTNVDCERLPERATYALTVLGLNIALLLLGDKPCSLAKHSFSCLCNWSCYHPGTGFAGLSCWFYLQVNTVLLLLLWDAWEGSRLLIVALLDTI